MRGKKCVYVLLCVVLALFCFVPVGCGKGDGKIHIELLQYKPEAVAVFEQIERDFNASHDDIRLTVLSPNEAMTVLKTRLIRENHPDIVGIGGDINYADFLDAGLFADISDFEGVGSVKEAYRQVAKALEYVPVEGTYSLPYAANAAGILYNAEMFAAHGWSVPATWSEFISLCETIRAEGVLPLYFGFKDVWTCLAPWNAIAVGVAPADTCAKVNAGKTTFAKEYVAVAEKTKALLAYCEPDPYAYSYNDACTAFARGQAAMYPIGSYAAPQILSVNPDMQIDSFVFPANEKESDNVLNSGIDLQFCVMKSCKKKDAAYEVLRFLYRDETLQAYLRSQNSVSCKEGAFALPDMLEGMRSYIEQGRLADYQDHHYPSAMSVDAMIQTYLIDNSENALGKFLQKFDKDWTRYNRDIIRKVKEYEEGK